LFCATTAARPPPAPCSCIDCFIATTQRRQKEQRQQQPEKTKKATEYGDDLKGEGRGRGRTAEQKGAFHKDALQKTEEEEEEEAEGDDGGRDLFGDSRGKTPPPPPPATAAAAEAEEAASPSSTASMVPWEGKDEYSAVLINVGLYGMPLGFIACFPLFLSTIDIPTRLSVVVVLVVMLCCYVINN